MVLESTTKEQYCRTCGSDLIEHGKVAGHNSVYFISKKAKFFSFGPPTVTLRAVLCLNCGAVTLKGDPNGIRKLIDRRQEDNQ